MTSQMKHEWVKLIASQSMDSKNKFIALLELLRDWRNRLEYMDASIREEPLYQGSGYVHQVTSDSKIRQRTRQRCWLHNLDGPPGEHPIWKCRLFFNKTVKERMDLVTANKACQRCLIVVCPGSSDINQCSRKFTCAAQGCGGNHNVLIHSKKAPVHHTNTGDDSVNIQDSPILPIQSLPL